MAHHSVALRRRQLLAAGVLACLGQTRASTPKLRDSAHLQALAGRARVGDLVFRRGASAESAVVLAAGRRSRFSHVGVVVSGAPQPRVVHAVPSEETASAGVVASSWADFAMARDVLDVAVYRLSGITAQQAQQIAETARATVGRPFNAAFSAATDGALYCTQVALLALAAADPAVRDAVHPEDLALVSDPVFLPDSLLQWSRLGAVL